MSRYGFGSDVKGVFDCNLLQGSCYCTELASIYNKSIEARGTKR